VALFHLIVGMRRFNGFYIDIFFIRCNIKNIVFAVFYLEHRRSFYLIFSSNYPAFFREESTGRIFPAWGIIKVYGLSMFIHNPFSNMRCWPFFWVFMGRFSGASEKG